MKNATIYDVAHDCGVSPSTVSRVVNQSLIVSSATRDRVIASMERLRYSAKREASLPERINNGFIIINLPTLNNPFYDEIMHGVTSAANRYGCTALLISERLTPSTIPKIKNIVKRLRAVGLITLSLGDPSTMLTLNTIVPLVQCCECDETLDIPSVTIDDASATLSAVEYLLSFDKRRIAFINGPIDTKYARERLRGYRDALDKHLIEFQPSLVTSLPEINYSLAVSAISQMLSHNNAVVPDALFASSDVFAIAAIRAAHLNNLRIPADLMVIGFDNIDLTSACIPSITTVNQPRTELGFVACDLLINHLRHPNAPIKHMTLATEMILRESTSIKASVPILHI